MSIDSIDVLARKLAEAVPPGLKSMRDDLEQSFRSVLRTGLGKLDLVSREEFEVQEAVLARTREMLELLEGRLHTLEIAADAPAKPAAKKARAKSSAKKTGKKKTAQ